MLLTTTRPSRTAGAALLKGTLLAALLACTALPGCARVKNGVAQLRGAPESAAAAAPAVRGMPRFQETGPQLMGLGNTVAINTSGPARGNTNGARVDTAGPGLASVNTSARGSNTTGSLNTTR